MGRHIPGYDSLFVVLLDKGHCFVLLIGALKVCMGYVGANNIKEMHSAKMYYAPAIKTEGKIYQIAGLGS